jgi:hypothetical protein
MASYLYRWPDGGVSIVSTKNRREAFFILDLIGTVDEAVRAAIYARVSTTQGQTNEKTLIELRRYVGARGWEGVEYVDEGSVGRRRLAPLSSGSWPTFGGAGLMSSCAGHSTGLDGTSGT